MTAAAVACIYAALTALAADHIRGCVYYLVSPFWSWLPQYHPILFLIGWAIPSLIVGLAAYGIVTHRVRSLGNETRCRRCGYILRGITEPRCSECGERI